MAHDCREERRVSYTRDDAGRKGEAERVRVYTKKGRYKSSFLPISLRSHSRDREHSSFFHHALYSNHPSPIYRFIPPVKKRKRKWPRNYTIGENSSAATRSIFLHKPVQLLYPRGTANILQPGPRGNRFPSLPVPRAAPISSRSEPEPPVAIPVQPNPTCSSRIYIFQRGLRSPSEPGRGICTSDNVQRSKMHRRGSRVGEDG